MALELETVDVRELLRASLTIVREKAATQRVELDLEADDDLGLLELDLRKTKQIVYNLLANAVKFAAGNGRVVLRARRVPREEVGALPGGWPVHGFRCRRGSTSSSSRSASPTPASASPRPTWPPRSRPSSRSTAAWPGSSRAPGWVWRWCASWPSCTAARWRWPARSARAPASPSGCRCAATSTGRRPWSRRARAPTDRPSGLRWSSRTTTGQPTCSGCCSSPRGSPCCGRPAQRRRSSSPRSRCST
ncbi:MAG: hybrid sensor histidine kinase/response regulator [Frankiales bacterium]|nr:hybrid sensor histidine kinase/response regulator [Frankiales bacterium]